MFHVKHSVQNRILGAFRPFLRRFSAFLHENTLKIPLWSVRVLVCVPFFCVKRAKTAVFGQNQAKKAAAAKQKICKKRRMRTMPHLQMRKIAFETRIRRICSLFYGKSAIKTRAAWGSTRVRYACAQNITAPYQNIGAVPLGAKNIRSAKKFCAMQSAWRRSIVSTNKSSRFISKS